MNISKIPEHYDMNTNLYKHGHHRVLLIVTIYTGMYLTHRLSCSSDQEKISKQFTNRSFRTLQAFRDYCHDQLFIRSVCRINKTPAAPGIPHNCNIYKSICSLPELLAVGRKCTKTAQWPGAICLGSRSGSPTGWLWRRWGLGGETSLTSKMMLVTGHSSSG